VVLPEEGYVPSSFFAVSADLIFFGKDERGPDLRLQFEVVSQFHAERRESSAHCCM
jgi:hypothetical protein